MAFVERVDGCNPAQYYHALGSGHCPTIGSPGDNSPLTLSVCLVLGCIGHGPLLASSSAMLATTAISLILGCVGRNLRPASSFAVLATFRRWAGPCCSPSLSLSATDPPLASYLTASATLHYQPRPWRRCPHFSAPPATRPAVDLVRRPRRADRALRTRGPRFAVALLSCHRPCPRVLRCCQIHVAHLSSSLSAAAVAAAIASFLSSHR